MGFTKKDHERFRKEYGRTTAFLKVLVRLLGPILRPVFRIGFIRPVVSNSSGGRVGAISRCIENGQHDKAFDLAIDALNVYRDRPAGADKSFRYTYVSFGHESWWFFMRLATECLQHCDDDAKWDDLIALAKSVGESKEDYQAAQSYLAFARRKYVTGDHVAAIEFAETASRADSTWGEPDIWLGWCRLMVGGGDAMAHLTEAVRKDSQMLFQIVKHPAFKPYPHVIQRLKEWSADRIVIAGQETE